MPAGSKITQETALAAAANWRLLSRLVPTVRLYLEPVRTGTGGARSLPKSKLPLSITASDLLFDLDQAASFYCSALLIETDDIRVLPGTLEEQLMLVADRHGHFTAPRPESEGDDVRMVRVQDPEWRPMPGVPKDARWLRDEAGQYERKARRVALDFCDEAEELIAKVGWLVLQPLPPRYMGPCLAQCGGDLWLEDKRTSAVCDTCASTADPTAVREQLFRAFESRLMKRSELAPALRLLGARTAVETVRSWIQRGRLVPVMREPQMFRFADAVELAGIDIAA